MLSRMSLLSMVVTIPAILIAFTFHEYAHALVADRLGDKTPKFQGRLTLNPLIHIDIFGFIMILIAGFGWAKPIQTNPSSYKNYYKDDLKVSIAGPVANLIVAIAFALIIGIYGRFFSNTISRTALSAIVVFIIDRIIWINIMLFFFNMMPLPGLDGFHVFRDLFPSRFYSLSDKLYRYQMLILIVFIATPISDYVIGAPSTFVYNLLYRVSDFITAF